MVININAYFIRIWKSVRIYKKIKALVRLKRIKAKLKPKITVKRLRFLFERFRFVPLHKIATELYESNFNTDWARWLRRWAWGGRHGFDDMSPIHLLCTYIAESGDVDLYGKAQNCSKFQSVPNRYLIEEGKRVYVSKREGYFSDISIKRLDVRKAVKKTVITLEGRNFKKRISYMSMKIEELKKLIEDCDYARG